MTSVRCGQCDAELPENSDTCAVCGAPADYAGAPAAGWLLSALPRAAFPARAAVGQQALAQQAGAAGQPVPPALDAAGSTPTGAEPRPRAGAPAGPAPPRGGPTPALPQWAERPVLDPPPAVAGGLGWSVRPTARAAELAEEQRRLESQTEAKPPRRSLAERLRPVVVTLRRWSRRTDRASTLAISVILVAVAIGLALGVHAVVARS